MQKVILWLLVVSIILLNVIFITNNASFIAFYYIFWVLIVGTLLWNYRTRIENWLVGWKLDGFKRFLLLGLFMILFEETFAGILHLSNVTSITDIAVGIGQFYAFNLLALPGLIIGWYVLMRRFVYTRKEIFVLAGVFGLFAEKIIEHALEYPLMAAFLLLPTMFTYAIIIAPSVMSYRGVGARSAPRIVRYPLGFIVPFIASIPLVVVLSYLRLHYPDAFPPPGFVG